jgi:hypothetical protein
MNRREFLQASVLSVAAAAASENQILGSTSTSAPGTQARHNEEVDFGYAFAPPHRMTVARPEASEKTLLDLEPGVLTISWSYDDLRNTPLAIFKTPRTGWHVKIQPLVDGKPLLNNSWSRGEEFLPMLNSKYSGPAGSVQSLASSKELRLVGSQEGNSTYELPAGTYSFRVNTQ